MGSLRRVPAGHYRGCGIREVATSRETMRCGLVNPRFLKEFRNLSHHVTVFACSGRLTEPIVAEHPARTQYSAMFNTIKKHIS